MGFISNNTWTRFKNVINKASEDFNQVTIIWKKSVGALDRFGEDNKTERFELIPLLCLAEYNKNRIWPVTFYSETGELDKESEVLLFNINYLRNLGYINDNGNFKFEESTDRIIHNGITYKCAGITNLSQAADQDLLCQLILQRELIETNKPTH